MSTTETAEPAVEYGGTFTFPSLCRPWRACSRDLTRPALCHPWLYRRDDGLWLCTSDSYIAVAVKVTEGSEGTVQDGCVPRAVVKLMRRGCEVVQVSATAWKVIVRPGYHEATYDVLGLSVGASKGYASSLEKGGLWGEPRVGEKFGDDIKLAFNPALTQRVHEALGGRRIEAQLYGPLTAIHFRSALIDGIALQMPERMPEDERPA